MTNAAAAMAVVGLTVSTLIVVVGLAFASAAPTCPAGTFDHPRPAGLKVPFICVERKMCARCTP